MRSDTSELRLIEPVTWEFEKCSMKLTCGGMTASHFQHILSPKTGVVSSLYIEVLDNASPKLASISSSLPDFEPIYVLCQLNRLVIRCILEGGGCVCAILVCACAMPTRASIGLISKEGARLFLHTPPPSASLLPSAGCFNNL